jgi:hypothetical protein
MAQRRFFPKFRDGGFDMTGSQVEEFNSAD